MEVQRQRRRGLLDRCEQSDKRRKQTGSVCGAVWSVLSRPETIVGVPVVAASSEEEIGTGSNEDGKPSVDGHQLLGQASVVYKENPVCYGPSY